MQLSIPLQASMSRTHDLEIQSTGSHHNLEACGSFHPYPWINGNKEPAYRLLQTERFSALIVLNSEA